MAVVSHAFRSGFRTAPAHERQTRPDIRAITLPIGIAARAPSHCRSPRPAIIIALLSAGLAGSFLPASAQCTPPIELIASDRLANDQFGEAVAISGDTAVVGAPNHHDPATSSIGAAYVFFRNGASWNQQAFSSSSPATSPRSAARSPSTATHARRDQSTSGIAGCVHLHAAPVPSPGPSRPIFLASADNFTNVASARPRVESRSGSSRPSEPSSPR